MALSGSDLAYKQARSGILRSGAGRSNYITPYFTHLTIAGTSRVSAVLKATLQITRHINETPSTATFTIREVLPVVGQSVVIGLGGADNPLFTGFIINVRTLQKNFNRRARYEVSCIDRKWLLDRKRITKYYATNTPAQLVADLVANFTKAGVFTYYHVDPSLASISAFPCTMEQLSRAMTRLANLNDGFWYLDDFDDLHLYGASGPATGMAGTPPLTLNDTNSRYFNFEYARDLSQVRTRVWVEGAGSQVVVRVPAGFLSLPLQSTVQFTGVTHIMIPEFGVYAVTHRDTGAIDYPLDVATSPGDQTIQLLMSGDPIDWVGPGWVRIGDDLVYFHAAVNDSPVGTTADLTGIPASGIGSITGSHAPGTSVDLVPYVSGNWIGADAMPGDIPEGIEVHLLVMSEDTAAQTALAALEGADSDGVHEHYIQDRRLNGASCAALGLAELVAFSTYTEEASWQTDDPNALPGRVQAIAITGNTDVSTSLTITEVTIDGFHRRATTGRRRLPTRRVTAVTVRRLGAIDLLHSLTSEGF